MRPSGLRLSPRRESQFRYLAVVGTAAVIDLGGFVILARAGLPVPLAAATSFLLAALFNYNAAARFVFRQRSEARRFGMFLLVGMIGLGVNTGITWWASASGVPNLGAKLAGIGVAFLVNTALNVTVVFRAMSLFPKRRRRDDP